MKKYFFILALFILGCEKETFTDTPKEIDPKVNLENRTGQPVNIFFDRSGVFASSHASDSVQTVVNLKHVDSIRYIADFQAPFFNYYGTQLMEYDIYFYEVGQLKYQRRAYAKFRGFNYRQLIGQLEGWDSDILFFHSVRYSTDVQNYFDHECLRTKGQHNYLLRYRFIDGTSDVQTQYIKSNVCNRNAVFYPKNFKPN